MDIGAGRVAYRVRLRNAATADRFFRLLSENGSENRKSLLHIPSRRLKGSAMLFTGS
jgi:hypothetical protein